MYLFVKPESNCISVRFDEFFRSVERCFSLSFELFSSVQPGETRLDTREVHAEFLFPEFLLFDPLRVLRESFNLGERGLSSFVGLFRLGRRKGRGESFVKVGGPRGRNLLQDGRRQRGRRLRGFVEVVLQQVRLTRSNNDLFDSKRSVRKRENGKNVVYLVIDVGNVHDKVDLESKVIPQDASHDVLRHVVSVAKFGFKESAS